MSTDQSARNGRYLGNKIGDRQIAELIGVARGLVADGELNDIEIEFLHKWLISNTAAQSNAMLALLLERIREIYSDGYVDEEERSSLTDILIQFTANDFEIGELLKSTSLPLTLPAPNIEFADRKFCFTGTFSYGTRTACESIVQKFGANCVSSVSWGTDYLVIGAYATSAWNQSTFGRKIEQALEFRANGSAVAIVSEYHWRNYI